MLKLAKNALLATVLFSTGDVEAKRHLDDSTHSRHLELAVPDDEYQGAVGELVSPLVEGTDCTPMCLFRDAHNYFCWKFQSPMLTAGWDWKQSTGTKYWQIQL